MKSKRKGASLVVIAIIIIIVIVVLAVALLYAFPAKQGGTALNGANATSTESLHPSYAPNGQIVAGFPSDLIMGSSTVMEESYAVDYGASANQYTAEFTAQTPIIPLAKLYRAYFDANGWTIQSDGFTTSTEAGFYATKGNDITSVALIAESATSSKVTASYVEQK